MIEWNIFEIGKTLFENAPKNKVSIDKHLGKNESSEEDSDNDSDGGSKISSTEEDDEDKEEREVIISLDKAVNVHDVTMLILKKLISGLSNDKKRQELNSVLQNMESLQGHILIDDGFKID